MPERVLVGTAVPRRSRSSSSSGRSRDRDASSWRCQVDELSIEIAVGAAEVAQPDRCRVHRVQVGQTLDQLDAQPADAARGEGAVLARPAHHDAGRPLHHEEGGSGDPVRLGVVDDVDRHGHRNSRALQGRDHPVLAAHVMGRREHVPERRAPQHERDPRALDGVGQVRPPTGDHRGAELAGGEVRVRRVEPLPQSRDVQARDPQTGPAVQVGAARHAGTLPRHCAVAGPTAVGTQRAGYTTPADPPPRLVGSATAWTRPLRLNSSAATAPISAALVLGAPAAAKTWP